MTKRIGWAAVVAGAALGCAGSPTGKVPSTAEAAPTAGKVLDDLAMLATGAPLDAARRRALEQKVAQGPGGLTAYVTELLADARFAGEVAPEIVFNKKAVDPSEEEVWETLKVTAGAPPIYFLREPCEAKVAVPVHPWWAIDTEVLVCPDSYQPTHLRQAETGWYCGGTNLDPSRSPFCGCGPNLMSCTRDDAQTAALKRGLQQELVQTVAYVVERDLPLTRLFTMNETVRTGYSELVYQRWQVVAGQRAGVSDVRAFAGEGKLTARVEAVPGQHAGLLTAPHVLLYGDTPRARMRNAFNDLWCVTPASVNVGTEQVLGLGVTDLRDGDGWKKLAVMPVCSDCHARLDHGMQFFAGYPSSFVGVVYHAPEGRPAAGEHGFLYGRGAGDLRGEGPLTPRDFAALAVKQPEFGKCMARDVADHVFNGDATPEDRRALVAAYDAAGTLRAVMREALLRYAARAREGSGAAPPEATLRSRIEARCQACHDGGEHAFPRDGAYGPELLGKMLRQVAFGDMPRAPVEIDAAERRALVQGLVAARWPDEASRREATRYFDGGMRGLGAHRGSALLGLVESRAHGHDEEAASWTFSDADRHSAVEARPSFVTTFALTALQTCKAAGWRGAALDACLDRALDVDAALKAGAR